MLNKIDLIEEQYRRLEEQLSDPEVTNDMPRFKKISKEYTGLRAVVEAGEEYRLVCSNIKNAKELLNEQDEEMRNLAKEELAELEPLVEPLEAQIRLLLIPKDPEDEKDVYFEIRSGTGGDEASLFAGDLYRMYSRYFDAQRWQVDVLDVSDGTAGGYSKLVLEVHGTDVYGKLKFESGAHRVQRVPETEAKGRVHTSAATVVVIPIYEQEEININKADLRVDTFRSSGAGGQHVNKTESGVRLTHLPTGIVSECTEGRSQIQNREIAMTRLYQRILDAQRAAFESEQTARRRSLVGTGDRSDKIRTYNFPQNRITDHRIDLTLYKLDRILNSGEIEEILDALQLAENTNRFQEEDN